jgi:hypothetical protein
MEKTRRNRKDAVKKSEPVLLLRPVTNSIGLDYLHMTLIVLVIVLVAFAFALSQFKQGVLVQSCAYGTSANETCITPVHNSTQVLAAAQQILASYATFNTSLSLLAYYTYANRANVSFLSGQKEWLVVFPYADPLLNNETQYFSEIIYDSNLTLAKPFIQTANPLAHSKNQVIGKGIVSIYGKVACPAAGTGQIPVYAFIDPYAPGAVQGIYAGINASSDFQKSINLTYKFIFTGYAESNYKSFGINQTQEVGEYLWCASQQSRFAAFMANFTRLYSGKPIPNSTVQQVAQGSGLNMSVFNGCTAQAPGVLERQVLLQQLYGVVSTPTYVVNCQYAAVPETLGTAIKFALNGTNQTA